MRIIKEGAKIITAQDDGGEYGRAFSILDTIEMPDTELDTIVRSWRSYLSQHKLTIKDYPFSLHFRIYIARTGEGK
jgi:hypothetical protein